MKRCERVHRTFEQDAVVNYAKALYRVTNDRRATDEVKLKNIATATKRLLAAVDRLREAEKRAKKAGSYLGA